MPKRTPPPSDFNVANQHYVDSHMIGHAPVTPSSSDGARPGWSNAARDAAAIAQGHRPPYGGVAQAEQPGSAEPPQSQGHITVEGGKGNPVMEAMKQRVKELMDQKKFNNEPDAYKYIESGKDEEYEKRHKAILGRPSFGPSPLWDLEDK